MTIPSCVSMMEEKEKKEKKLSVFRATLVDQLELS